MAQKPHNTISIPNRMLRALIKIYEDPKTSTAEKLQAVRLSAEILPFRTVPKRKTEKDKLLAKALQKGIKKEEAEASSKDKYFKKKPND